MQSWLPAEYPGRNNNYTKSGTAMVDTWLSWTDHNWSLPCLIAWELVETVQAELHGNSQLMITRLNACLRYNHLSLFSTQNNNHGTKTVCRLKKISQNFRACWDSTLCMEISNNVIAIALATMEISMGSNLDVLSIIVFQGVCIYTGRYRKPATAKNPVQKIASYSYTLNSPTVPEKSSTCR